jgi:hypothetical protein
MYTDQGPMEQLLQTSCLRTVDSKSPVTMGMAEVTVCCPGIRDFKYIGTIRMTATF